MNNHITIELSYLGKEIGFFCPACGSPILIFGADPVEERCDHVIAIFSEGFDEPDHLNPSYKELAGLGEGDGIALSEFIERVSTPSVMFLSVTLSSGVHGPNSTSFTIGIDYEPPPTEVIGRNIERLDKLLRAPDGLTIQLENAPSRRWQLQAEHVVNIAEFAKRDYDLDKLRFLDAEAARLLADLEKSD